MLSNINYFYVIYPPVAGGNHLCNLISLHEAFYQRFPSTKYIEDLIQFYDDRQKLKYSPEKFSQAKQHAKVELVHNFEFQQLSSLMYNAHPWETTLADIKLDSVTNPILHSKVEIDGETFNDLRMFYNNIQCHSSYNVKDTEKKIYVLESHGVIRAARTVPASEDKFVQNFWKSLRNKDNTYAIFMTVPKVKGRAYERLYEGNKGALSLIKEQNYKVPFSTFINGSNRELFNDENSFCINTDRFFEDDGYDYLQEMLQDKLKIQLPPEAHTIHKLWINMIDNGLREIKKITNA